MDINIIQELYNFYNPLMPKSRTIMTLDYDLCNHLKITKDKALKIYLLYMKSQENISIFHNSENFYNYINNFPYEEYDYKDYILKKEKNKNSIYKSLYSLEDPNFIYRWIEFYKNYFSDNVRDLINKVLSKSYSRNKIINEYLKRKSFKELMLNIFGNNFLTFYDFCRIQYLKNNIVSSDFIPKFYNSYTGIFYFSTTKPVNWEHIYERLNKNSLKIKYNSFVINTSFGLISLNKEITKRKWNCDINLDFEVPNVIKDAIEYIMLKNKTIENINEAKVNAYKNSILTEDFCKRKYNGKSMIAPVKNTWKEIESKVLRKMVRSSININKVFEDYSENLLNPVLQGIWS